MNRVFVDMDGVIANFDGMKRRFGMESDQFKQMTGAYLMVEPFEEGLAGVRSLIGAGYEVWIATKPPTGIAGAYSDKAAWILKYLPELSRRIIITHDKGLLGDAGDFLIDDRPHKANCDKFPGMLIKFINGITWPEVIKIIRAKTSAASA